MLFWIVLLFLCSNKFGLALGGTGYFPNLSMVQLPFPITFDIIVELETSYFLPLLYLFSLYSGIPKQELWSPRDTARLYYSYRGRKSKLHYHPSTSIHLKRGELLQLERKGRKTSYTSLGRQYPLPSPNSPSVPSLPSLPNL